MLDRLMRGRTWIGLLGVLLIGLVALNVSLLKLNSAAGRNAELAKKLRIENADLRGRVSRLGSGGRLQEAARELGLVMPRANDIHYLSVDPVNDARRAAKHASLIPLPFTDDIVSSVPEEPLAPPVHPTSAPATALVPAAAPVGATGAQGAATVSPSPVAETQPATTPTTQTPPSGAPARAAPTGGVSQP
jgi:hypothetical protein